MGRRRDLWTRSKTEERGGRYNDKGRNGHRGTVRNRNNRNYREVNNCAGWEEEVDGENDFDGDWDTTYYQGDRHLSQVNFTENNASSIWLKFGDIANLYADSGIGNYLVNRSVVNEYRDSGRPGGCEVSKRVRGPTWRGELGSVKMIVRLGDSDRVCVNIWISVKVPRAVISKYESRKCFRERLSELSTEVGVHLVGDCEQRGTSTTPGEGGDTHVLNF